MKTKFPERKKNEKMKHKYYIKISQKNSFNQHTYIFTTAMKKKKKWKKKTITPEYLVSSKQKN